MHRTALPEKLLSTWSQYSLFEPNIISSNASIKLEEHTYFLRSVADNPNMGANWLKCYAQRWEEIPTKSNITCSEHLEKVDELFRFNLVTKNFTYAYLGSWDLPQEERKYFGDSSVFAFGTCKPYYDYAALKYIITGLLLTLMSPVGWGERRFFIGDKSK